MKGRKIDFATETYQKSKEARQNHIDAIRKLQHVKNKLSPSKPSRDDGTELYDISSSPGKHDSGYDPSSEMTFVSMRVIRIIMMLIKSVDQVQIFRNRSV